MKTLVFPFLFIHLFSFAQSVPALNEINDSSTTIQFNYSNDLFFFTDQYFTQGFGLYLQKDVKSDNSLKTLFFGGKSDRSVFEIDLGHNAYTPTTIRADSLLVNDRPFAATMISHLTAKSQFKSRNLELFYGLDLGIIGPLAQGKQMQTAIHKATNNAIPLGWQFQLNNGIVLDGRIGFRHYFLPNNRFLRINLGSFLRGGTLKTDFNFDANLKIGFLNNKTKIAFYTSPSFRLVARDGTMQGALFSGTNQAAVPSSSVSRFVFEQHAGLFAQFNRFEMLLYLSFQSKLLRFDSNHRWGGITIGTHF